MCILLHTWLSPWISSALISTSIQLLHMDADTAQPPWYQLPRTLPKHVFSQGTHGIPGRQEKGHKK